MRRLVSLAQSEPARLWLYGVAGAVLAVLVGYGLLTETEATLWAAVAVAVLTPPATELTRASVASPRTLAESIDRAYQRGISDASSPAHTDGRQF